MRLLCPGRSSRGRAADPRTQMRVPSRPRQHGARDAEIIVLSGRATVDDPGLTHLGVKSDQLLISTSARRSGNKSDLMGLQLGMKKFEKIASTSGVEQHCAVFDRPPLRLQAVAMATDLQPNHARTKGLVQDLGIARVIAQVRDNERIAVVMAVNLRQFAGPRTTIKTLWQLLQVENAKQLGFERTVAADNRGGTVAATPHIMGNDERPKAGPGGWIVAIETHSKPPTAPSVCAKGFAMRTPAGSTGGPNARPGGTNGTCAWVARSYSSHVNGLACAPSGMPRYSRLKPSSPSARRSRSRNSAS